MQKNLIGFFLYFLMVPAWAVVVVNKGAVVDVAIDNHVNDSYFKPSLGYGVKKANISEGIDSVYMDGGRLLTVSDQIINIWHEDANGQLKVVDRFYIGFLPSAITAYGGRLYIGNLQGDLFIATPSKPEQSLYFKLHGGVQAIAVAKDKVYVHLVEGDAVILAFDAEGGVFEQGKFYMGGRARDLSVEARNVFYFKGHSVFYAINHAPDFSSWNVGENINDIFVANGMVYVSIDDGVVIAKLENEQLVWHSSYRGIGRIDRLLMVNEKLIAAAHSGVFYAFKMVRDDHLEMVSRMPKKMGIKFYGVLNDRVLTIDDSAIHSLDFSQEMPKFSNELLDQGQGANYGGQRKIYIDGKTMYVADWFSGVHIYDISHASKPTLLSSVHTPGSSKGVVVQNGIAYVADDDHGLQVVDVRDPLNPSIIAELALQGLAYTPVIDEGVLYMASHRGGVQIIDIKTPGNPVLLGEFNTPGMAWSLQVNGGVMLVADDEAGILSLDIHDPSKIKLLGQLDLGGRVEDIFLDDDLAYVAMFDYGVKKIDVSDPRNLVELSGIALPGNARGLDVVGDRLFVASWKAGAFVLDKQSLQILSQQDTPGAAWGLKVSGRSIYVADWWAGMVTLSLSGHSKMDIVDEFFRRDRVFDFVMQDRFLYAAQGKAGLQVFEVSNGMNPTWITGVDTGTTIDHLIGNRQALYAWGNDQSLRIYDRSRPFDTRYRGQIYLGDKVSSVALLSDTLFVGTDSRLTVYDVSALFEPIRLFELKVEVQSLALSDTYMVVLETPRMLSIWEVSQVGDPVFLERVSFEESIKEIQIHGELLWLVEGTGTIKNRKLNDVQSAFTVFYEQQVIDQFLIADAAIYVAGNQVVTVLSADGKTQVEFPLLAHATKMLLHHDLVQSPSDQAPVADVLLIAGGKVPIAIDLAYPQVQSYKNKAVLKVDIPMQTPSGDYDFILGASSAQKRRVEHKALRVKQLRFSKPKMSMRDFQKRLKAHKKKRLNESD